MILCGIQVRLGSSRLPGKVLMNIGKKRIIDLVIEKCQASNKIDKVIVAIGDEPENDAIVEYCEREGVSYVRGSEGNLLRRHMRVLESEEVAYYVRITGDCPFVPPQEIDRTIEEHIKSGAEYTTNNTEEMPIGTAVDVFNPDVLRRLQDEGAKHPVKKMRDNPEKWGVNFVNNSEWEIFRHVHMAVDTPEDYWSLIDAQKEVGDNPVKIAGYLLEKQ